jgi:putative DNA primase/helicase
MGGQRIQAGQTVRLLDILTERQPGSAWDDLHHHASGVAFSDALKVASFRHYGHAGRAFVERLSRDETDMLAMLAGIRALPGMARDGGGQVQRAAGRFAVLAMAGELATSYGITGWPEGEAVKAAVVAFESWCGQRSSGDGANIEAGQAVEALSAFIERNGSSRFSSADEALDPSREALIRDRAGYWRDTSDGGRMYLFNAAGMREALKGFDLTRALDALQAAGLIGPPGSDGKRQKPRRVHGQQFKAYEVWPDGVPRGKQ